MTTALSCPVPDTRGPAPLTRAGFSFYPTTVSITKAAADSAHCERVQLMFPTKSKNMTHPARAGRSWSPVLEPTLNVICNGSVVC